MHKGNVVTVNLYGHWGNQGMVSYYLHYLRNKWYSKKEKQNLPI